MTVADQIQYESRVRFRYAVIAFAAALLLVASQLLNISRAEPPVNELTLSLIAANHDATIDIIGSVVDLLGLLALGPLLFWLHQVTRARRPEMQPFPRWLAIVGAVLAGVLALAAEITVAIQAHQFVTTGTQSYPEAHHLTGGVLIWLQLLAELGALLLAIGCILVSLSAMRVGLITKLVGYMGVVSGALFLFPLGALVPVLQGFWLAALAVTLAARWPQGDPPAWEAGVAIPWPSATQAAQQAQKDRPARGQRRRRVSDRDVFEAVESNEAETPPNPTAGRSKRKRRR